MHVHIATERLISEVRQRPALWDSSDESYRDKDARSMQWLEICETLYPDYKKETNTKKKEIRNAIQQRWKTARDAYIRCKNKSSKYSDGKRKKYAFYDELTFLRKHDKYANSNNKKEESINSCNTSESDSSEYNAMNNVFVECRNTDSMIEIDIEQDHISDSAISDHERKKPSNDNFDKEMLQVFKENANMLKNDDLAFFMSLLPVMENFTMSQKLVFRTEVLKKAMEIGGMPDSFATPSSSAATFPFKTDC